MMTLLPSNGQLQVYLTVSFKTINVKKIFNKCGTHSTPNCFEIIIAHYLTSFLFVRQTKKSCLSGNNSNMQHAWWAKIRIKEIVGRRLSDFEH